jgi:hypothetical protein
MKRRLPFQRLMLLISGSTDQKQYMSMHGPRAKGVLVLVGVVCSAREYTYSRCW